MLSLGLTSYEMEQGFYDLFTSYEIEVETHLHEQIENQLEMHVHVMLWYVNMVWYIIMVWYGMLVWYDVSMLLCVSMV